MGAEGHRTQTEPPLAPWGPEMTDSKADKKNTGEEKSADSFIFLRSGLMGSCFYTCGENYKTQHVILLRANSADNHD